LNKVSVFKVISSFVQGMTVNPIAALFRWSQTSIHYRKMPHLILVHTRNNHLHCCVIQLHSLDPENAFLLQFFFHIKLCYLEKWWESNTQWKG
jgi:hypothetical protein